MCAHAHLNARTRICKKDVLAQGNKYGRGKHTVYTKGLTCCHGDLILYGSQFLTLVRNEMKHPCVMTLQSMC